MPTILDLCCGSGGAGMGYSLAGWNVIGVDNRPQPYYPFEFIQGNIFRIDYDNLEFDAVHVSPPCQRYSSSTGKFFGDHPDLIPRARELAQSFGKPYLIENVMGAPLRDPVLLCGTMFDLHANTRYGIRYLYRHRLFETSFPVPELHCDHYGRKAGTVYGNISRNSQYGKNGGVKLGLQAAKEAMQCPWINRGQGYLSEAIPPAYTRYLANFIPTSKTST